MDTPKILAVVGSLREGSYNRRLALATREIVGDRAAFTLLEYADVPLFNQDIEHPAPEAVRRVREAVKAADGLWFFTPEYNHSFPGVLKNLIDWLSRPVGDTGRQVLSHKPTAVSGIAAGMCGTATAQDQLVMLISLLNMRVMNYPRLTVPNAAGRADAQGRLRLDDSLPFITRQVSAYMKFLNP